MLKKAMIMAAGVGSRLEPLTSVVPKPLVPLANVPTMEILAKHLLSFGIKDIIANTYHKAEQIEEYFKKNNLGIDFKFVKETELSGTAGGVKKCQFFFNEDDDFIVMSGDGLSDIDIKAAYDSHIRSNAIATIVIREVEDSEISKFGIVVTDKDGYVESFQEKPSIEDAKSNLANTGIYIFNYKIFDYIPANTFYDFAKNVFPTLMLDGMKINTFKMNGYWSDIGSIEQYKQSNKDLIDKIVKSYLPVVINSQSGKYVCEDKTFADNNIRIEGNVTIGKNCEIGKNCIIKNSVIWHNVKIKDNVKIENSIILPNSIVEDSCENAIIVENKEKAMI